MEQVYLITPNEYKRLNIVKIGRHKGNTMKRITSYGAETIVYSVVSVSNSKTIEKELINQFKTHFKLYKGREYFEADINESIFIFKETIEKMNTLYESDNIDDELCLKFKSININSNNSPILKNNFNKNKIVAKKNSCVYNLERIISCFKESIDINNVNYNNIILYGKIYEFIINDKDNEKTNYNKIYNLYNLNTINKQKKFRLKIKRCYLFINEIKSQNINFNYLKISPDSLSRLTNSNFYYFIENLNYIKNNSL